MGIQWVSVREPMSYVPCRRTALDAHERLWRSNRWHDQASLSKDSTLGSSGVLWHHVLVLGCAATLRANMDITGAIMRIFQLWLLVLALCPTSGFAESDVGAQDLTAKAQLAETAALTILNFEQGDLNSLIDAKAFFTPSGWADFKQGLAGSLDQSGVPTFSSSFSPSGAALDVTQDRDSISLTFPGVLKHESRNQHGGVSSSAYRAEIDIRTSASPLKLEMVEQRICGGAAIMTSCR